ncbi:MAG: T9SS type A sorting domain-containing protein [Bacteroidales bacterium]
MQKLISSLLPCLFAVATLGNPLPEPPIISELHIIDENTWYLEIMFNEITYVGDNLNGWQVSTNGGTAQIKNGLTVEYNEIIVLTSDSLQSPININPAGDVVALIPPDGYPNNMIRFGDVDSPDVIAPDSSQSIVNFRWSCYDYASLEPSHRYKMVLDNEPGIGENAFTPNSASGFIAGYVYDGADNPVEGICVGNGNYGIPEDDCDAFTANMTTDPDGAFSGEQWSGRHHITTFSSGKAFSHHDTIINITPDSNNNLTIHLDTVLTGSNNTNLKEKARLYVYPNPSSNLVNFDVNLPSYVDPGDAVLKIFNNTGKLVKIIRLDNNHNIGWTGKNQNKHRIPGIYHCKLEYRGRYLASVSMVLQ